MHSSMLGKLWKAGTGDLRVKASPPRSYHWWRLSLAWQMYGMPRTVLLAVGVNPWGPPMSEGWRHLCKCNLLPGWIDHKLSLEESLGWTGLAPSIFCSPHTMPDWACWQHPGAHCRVGINHVSLPVLPEWPKWRIYLFRMRTDLQRSCPHLQPRHQINWMDPHMWHHKWPFIGGRDISTRAVQPGPTCPWWGS